MTDHELPRWKPTVTIREAELDDESELLKERIALLEQERELLKAAHLSDCSRLMQRITDMEETAMRPTGSRRAARKDHNDNPLAGRAKKNHGWLIIHMAPGQGFDWLALLPCGCKEIVEIKNPEKRPSARKLTDQELSLFQECVSRNIAYRIIETEAQLDQIALSHAGHNCS